MVEEVAEGAAKGLEGALDDMMTVASADFDESNGETGRDGQARKKGLDMWRGLHRSNTGAAGGRGEVSVGW